MGFTMGFPSNVGQIVSIQNKNLACLCLVDEITHKAVKKRRETEK